MWTLTPSPVGEIRVTERDGAIVALEFAPLPEARLLPESERDDEHPLLREAVRQLDAYFAGELREFDLPLAPVGTPFQMRVWQELRGIGYGETTSYGAIAARLGMVPGASRAVGLANGRNPIAIAIPCHRVIGANGTLTGYAGGLDRKRALLGLERGAGVEAGALF
ncbi:methylated-DNA--[protein]-cysteine S-methyltransferase [Nocardioides ferulae]|uniref:methylated-DNA--[protein]-cysteine S-methyltransferase n=1 Tax=Nocardioides ferulae TaxID=2340821 RepID=UPI000EAB5A57|nr:methylated-DNA--[protein]-cysteine S-methyltransferase [Nocardioides ferulae]